MSDHSLERLGTMKRSLSDTWSRRAQQCPTSLASRLPRAMAPIGIAMLLGLALTLGCASLNLKSPTTWLASNSDEPQAPKSITAVWSPAVLERADGTRARGFGGRLMFYPKKGHTPTRVDGTLIVYAYDDQDRDPEQTRPSRKYVITRQQFASHHSKSDLGDSYSVWIPWDQVDDSTKHVSLIARFSPAEGSAVVSAQAKVTLAGSSSSPIADCPTSSTRTAEAKETTSVRTASHETTCGTDLEQETNPPIAKQMITTTIPVPGRQRQR